MGYELDTGMPTDYQLYQQQENFMPAYRYDQTSNFNIINGQTFGP
jgi:hypothetical protein